MRWLEKGEDILRVAFILALCSFIVGYMIGYRRYDFEIKGLGDRVDVLIDEVSKLESQYATLRAEQNRYESLVSSLQMKLDDMSDSVATLNYMAPVDHYDADLASHYNLLFIKDMGWDVRIPVSVYVEYRERPRPDYVDGGWARMAKDPGDDLYIGRLAEQMNRTLWLLLSWRTDPRGPTDIERINFVATFVQEVPYILDNVTNWMGEYPKYPVETLFDYGGDCEDKAILAAAILDSMGYDVSLLIGKEHVTVGVALKGVEGEYFEYRGEQYYNLEVTLRGARLGSSFPYSPTGNREPPVVYPLNP